MSDYITLTIQVLESALKRISAPKNWIQKTSAATKIGEAVPSWDIHADRWCATGAIERSCLDLESWKYKYYLKIVGELEKDCGGRLVTFNDKSSHSQVIDLFNRTLKRLKKNEHLSK